MDSMILADRSLPPTREVPPWRARIFCRLSALLGMLLLLLCALSSCADKEPATPLSADEAAMKAEQKAAEHRVFYEGWLHPGG